MKKPDSGSKLGVRKLVAQLHRVVRYEDSVFGRLLGGLGMGRPCASMPLAEITVAKGTVTGSRRWVRSSTKKQPLREAGTSRSLRRRRFESASARMCTFAASESCVSVRRKVLESGGCFESGSTATHAGRPGSSRGGLRRSAWFMRADEDEIEVRAEVLVFHIWNLSVALT